MDAYGILGVGRNASKAEIDAAYKALLEKYSEEKYTGGPLADLAEKKRAELSQAYDEVIKDRAQRAQAEQSSAGGGNTFTGATSPEYAQIRQFINIGNLTEAERLLADMKNHDAEWHYLAGCIALRRGNYNGAYSNFKTATNKDPMNMEYKNAFMGMQQNAGGYRNMNTGDMSQTDCCNCCSNLICADCLCECCGGDLIPCC